MEALLALILSMPGREVVGPSYTGAGVCLNMDTHWHVDDQACHRDDNDEVVPVIDPDQDQA